MTAEVEQLRIATSTGLVHWALIVHVAAGVVGLITGFVALAIAKGSRGHKLAGRLFVASMIAMGLLATGLAAYEGKPKFLGGAFVAYLIFTAMTTMRPFTAQSRAIGIALAVFVIGIGVAGLSVIALLAGLGDLRMIRAGGLQGVQRLVRHIWRMCAGLFVASGSFFLGQMRLFPEPLQHLALLAVPAGLPLVALVYWLWRVRGAQAKNRLRFVSVL